MLRRLTVTAAFAVALCVTALGVTEKTQAHGGWFGGPAVVYGGGIPVYGGGYAAAYHRLATPYPYVYTDYGLITAPVVVTPRFYGPPGRVYRGYRGFRNPGVSVFVGF